MRAKDAVGKYGEDVAAAFLGNAGFAVVERNWRCREGEIDLVARDGDVLVFCEVKTRRTTAFGLPAEAVTRTKADRLRRLALLWLRARQQNAGELRFDVISVVCQPSGAAAVEHVRGAF